MAGSYSFSLGWLSKLWTDLFGMFREESRGSASDKILAGVIPFDNGSLVLDWLNEDYERSRGWLLERQAVCRSDFRHEPTKALRLTIAERQPRLQTKGNEPYCNAKTGLWRLGAFNSRLIFAFDFLPSPTEKPIPAFPASYRKHE